MGNDSSYTIKITGSKKDIDSVLQYVEEKTRRWENWDSKTKGWDAERRIRDRENEMKRLGIEKRAGFVTWGFVVDGREDCKELSTLTLGGWANENSSNCYISGAEGELAVLYELFPNLEYSVDYSDDYSQGFCLPPYFEKQENEESADTFELEDATCFLTFGNDGLMERTGMQTGQYKYLGEGVAKLLQRRLGGDIDLSGLEWIDDVDAAAIAAIKHGVVILSPATEELVRPHRKKTRKKAPRNHA